MPTMIAALGVSQLKKIGKIAEMRRKNAAYITAVLRKIDGLKAPVEVEGRKHIYHQYGFRVTEDYHLTRDGLLEKLNKAGIGARKGYFMPIYEQPFYRDMGFPQDCPVAKKVLDQIIELPIHPALTEEDLKFMAETIKNA